VEDSHEDWNMCSDKDMISNPRGQPVGEWVHEIFAALDRVQFVGQHQSNATMVTQIHDQRAVKV